MGPTALCHVLDLHVIEFEAKLCAQVNELQCRVSAALSEATNRSQASEQSLIDTNGFASWIKGVFGSSEDEFDRTAEDGKLLTYLEQASIFLSSIVQVSLRFN